jgi:hypothetical protein
MSATKQSFKVGEKVEESGNYVCEICHTEGGVDEHEFKEGQLFPACMNCGKATTWKKTKK